MWRLLLTGQTHLNKTADSWYAVLCRPLKEFFAETALRQGTGILTYLATAVSRVHGATREVPFFPGYLFVNADLGEVRLSSINVTAGVVRLVEFDSEPLEVPKVLISAIKEGLDALNAQGGLPAHNFHPGDRVLLKSGPFRGLQAVFLGPIAPSAHGERY